MEINMINVAGEAAGNVQVADSIFTKEYNEALIHQVVTSFMANQRQASKAQKTRSEVSGGGAKPFRQKGTGRARAGTTRGPIWVGGGRAFAARPDRNYTHKINRKMYRGAMASILAELLRQDRLVVVDEIKLDAPKTKEAKGLISALNGSDQKVLFIDSEFNENFVMGVLNLPHVYLLSSDALNPYDLVAADKIVLSKGALEGIQEWLS